MIADDDDDIAFRGWSDVFDTAYDDDDDYSRLMCCGWSDVFDTA
jgi:hypothetical protein